MKKWLWLLALCTLVRAQEPAFEESLAEAARHPAQVRALRIKMTDWPFGQARPNALEGVWPDALKGFSQLQVLEADGLAGADVMVSFWHGPSPYSSLRRLSLKNTIVNFQAQNPPDFGSLEVFDIRGTFRTGAMYASLSRAANLRRLDLSYGELELGVNPPHWPQLRELNLSETALTQVPPWIGKLSNLEKLDLSGNELETLPPELYQLKHLRELKLGGNRLRQGDWRKLTELRRLEINHNPLQTVAGLPASLRELDLTATQITELPQLPPGLVKLRASRNQLSRLVALPASLEELDLSFNQLAVAPVLPPQLRVLDLSFNQLTEFVPAPGLSELNLSHNQLTQFSSAFAKKVDLSHNGLTAFPEVEGVEYLNLGANQLAALPEVPPTGLESLRRLELHANQLREIPPGWGGLALTNLSLSLNPLENFPGQGFTAATTIEILGHRLKTPQLEALSRQHRGLVATEEGPAAFSQSPQPGPEEYRVLRTLLSQGLVVEHTVNGYSPVGRSLEKRKRFYAALQHLKRLPADLVSSFAFNNLERARLDSDRLGLPLLLQEERVLAAEDALELRSRRQIILGVSRVGFSYDGQMALAYCQSAAGRLNCLGALVVLRKIGGDWQIVDNIAVWAG